MQALNLPHTKSIQKFLALFFSIAYCLTQTQASPLSTQETTKIWHPVMGLGLGGAIPSNLGESQNATIGLSFYNYSANRSIQTVGLIGLFLGGEVNLQPHWALQVGMDYTQATPFTVRGSFLQGMSIPSADAGVYQYSAVTRQLLMVGKLLYTVKEGFHPYALVGLGTSFNTASSYVAILPSTLSTPSYFDNTAISFSYALGFGLDWDMTAQWRLGLGYRFADLGQLNLGNGVLGSTSISNTLSQSHLYINEFLVQLSYVFG